MKKIWEIESLEEYRELNKSTFKDHVATYQSLGKGTDCIIDFRVPNSSLGWMRFVYIDGVLNINGDYGYSIFNWYNNKNSILVYPLFTSIGYILEKCVSAKKEDIKGFDIDLFYVEYKKFIQERKDDGYIPKDKEFDIPNIESHEEVLSHFINNYREYGDDLWDTEALELGSYIEERPYIWWHGLSSAIEQLTAKGVLKY